MTDDLCKEAVTIRSQHPTTQAAADAMGIPRGTLQHRLREAARRGMAPGHFNNGTAPGYLMGKVTVQRNANGDVERTWERQSPDQEQALEALRAAVEAMAGEITPAAPIAAPA